MERFWVKLSTHLPSIRTDELSGQHRCSAYLAVGLDVRSAGGEYVGMPVDQAYMDGNLVAVPAWPVHPD